jgi:thymidine phosphorylase
VQNGFIVGIDTRALGMAVVGLGGGRRKPSDKLDYAVGLTQISGLGQQLGAGEPLAIVHAQTAAAAEQAVREVQAAFSYGLAALASHPIIY